ncbi:TetR/AcrR family transcriptional regulator [Flammeovirga sp. SubArs3]|uniref:TetR/AcrR family transcriptional regulator n=1 Tax=Flammeovirga sp. SubArs3 TaxID=2995316 RepID=UPI00248CD4C8|nr:TetR/AcrR family transcriptional regulator [Flammeovirga sp. SubArs3]
MSKKENILSSALELLTENGIHNTPMSEIARVAGTGMGTIYNYFPTKEILINEVYISIKAQEISIFTDFDKQQPIRTQFEMYFRSAISFFINNPMYFKFIEQLQASPVITDESRKFGRKSIAPVVELIQNGQKQRIIKDIPIDEILTFIAGAILSYLRWYFNQTETKDSSLKNQMNLLWDAIKE